MVWFVNMHTKIPTIIAQQAKQISSRTHHFYPNLPHIADNASYSTISRSYSVLSNRVPQIFLHFRPFSSEPQQEWIQPFSQSLIPNTKRKITKPSPWVKQVVETLQNPDPEMTLNNLCTTHSLKFSPQFVEHILGLPEIVASPTSSLVFFTWAGKQKDYEHTFGCYASTMTSLGATNDTQRIRHVFNELKSSWPRLHCTTGACNNLIKNFGKLRMIDEALDTWKAMRENGIESGIFTYNCLIEALVNVGRIDDALKVFGFMKKQGRVDPDVVSYNTMIRGLCESRRNDTALSCFRDMEKKWWPDQVSYVTLMRGFYSEGKYDMTLRLFSEMLSRNLKIIPDAYEAVICSFCIEGEVFRGYELLQKMLERGCKPTMTIYLFLIEGFVEICDHDKALEILRHLNCSKTLKGSQIEKSTCDKIVNWLCEFGEVELGLDFLDHFKELGIDMSQYCCLILGGFDWGKDDKNKAVRILSRIKEKGYFVDKDTCFKIIDGFSACGELEMAQNVVDQFRELGLEVSSLSYSSVIHGLIKAESFGEAEQVFDEMQILGHDPDVDCCNSVIQGLSKVGKIERAMEVSDYMEEQCFDLTLESYIAIIDGLLKAGNEEMAMEIWNDMMDKGVTPTPEAFKVVSTGLCLLGNAAKANRILNELTTLGVFPDDPYPDMLHALIKSGHIVTACRLADYITGKEREVPERIRLVMLTALRKTGNVDLAWKLVTSSIAADYTRIKSIKKRIKFITLLH